MNQEAQKKQETQKKEAQKKKEKPVKPAEKGPASQKRKRNEQFQWNYEDQPPELWDQYKSQAAGDTHIRIHPLLHWTEKDIWGYVKRESIPFVDLYRARDHKRYRSIGCETCCSPVESDATTIDEIIAELEVSRIGEREGRAQDKEDAETMQKLRALGYM